MNRKDTVGTQPSRIVISEDPQGKIIVLSLFLAFLWGGNSLSIKVSLADIDPMTLAFVRFAIGFVFVGVWALYRGIPLGLKRGEFSRLFILTVIFIFQIITLNIGTKFTTASLSTIYISTYPFFTAIFAHLWIPQERLSILKTFGVIIAFSGVLVSVAPNFGNGETTLFGDIMVLVSGCLLGLRVVVTKLLVQSIHPYRLLVWYLGLSLPCYGILSVLFERGLTFELSLAGSAAILYQGFVIAGFCFLAWTAILERYNASKLVVLFFATPLSGVLFSHLLLDDALTFSLLVGVFLVAAGIYLVNKQR